MPTGVEADSDDDGDMGGSELCAISLLTNCMINIAICTQKCPLVNRFLSSKMASTLTTQGPQVLQLSQLFMARDLEATLHHS